MKRFSFLILFLIPLILFSQEDTSSKGIKWITGLSWDQVKQKAKLENKYIFVDCYATWCVPCKKMDREVYSLEKVGEKFNQKFISIKVQMDTLITDNKEVRKWYEAASQMKLMYNVNAFPTYLFFDTNGNIVHRDYGYRYEVEFLALADDATNPKRQYYTLLKKYDNKSLDYSEMANLANLAVFYGDVNIAQIIALDYFDNYLSLLKDNEFYTSTNIRFILNFTSTDSKYLDFIYRNKVKVDSVMGVGYTAGVRDKIIYNNEISSLLVKADEKNIEPNWKLIRKRLKVKFGTVDANRNVLLAKLVFYDYKNNPKKYAYAAVSMINKFKNNLNCFSLNEFAWNIFLKNNDKRTLAIALKWSTESIETAPSRDFTYNFIDTKANLLYKLGKRDDAISIQEHLVSSLKSKPTMLNPQFVERLEKMKSGTPTWIVKEQEN